MHVEMPEFNQMVRRQAMTRTSLILAVFLSLGGAALAHKGVTNPAVMARMDSMSAIAGAMKTLGQMSKGAIPFDAAAARAAAAEIARQAAATPALFEAQEDDPKSEARAEIWTRFADFTAKSADLEAVAAELSKGLASQGDLGPAMGRLGDACKACHSDYRE